METYYIYCLTNSLMPNLCKVGFTTVSVEQRLKELSSSTSCPTKFNCEYYIACLVNNENKIHNDIMEKGIKRLKRKEFFECNPNEIKHIFQKYGEIKYFNNKYDIDYTKNKKKSKDLNELIQLSSKKSTDKYNCPFCLFTTKWISNFKTHLGKEKKCNKDIDAVKYEEIIDLVNEHKGKREPFVVKNGKIVKIHNKEGIICSDCGVKLSNKRSIYAHKKNHCKKTLLELVTEEEPVKDNYISIIGKNEKLTEIFNEIIKELLDNKPDIKLLIEEAKIENKTIYWDYGNYDFDRFNDIDFNNFSPFEYVDFMIKNWLFNEQYIDLYCVRVPEKLVGTNYLEIRKEGKWILSEKKPVILSLENACRKKMVLLCENEKNLKNIINTEKYNDIVNFLQFNDVVNSYFEIFNKGLENDKKAKKEFNNKLSSTNYNFKILDNIINEYFEKIYCNIVSSSKKLGYLV